MDARSDKLGLCLFLRGWVDSLTRIFEFAQIIAIEACALIDSVVSFYTGGGVQDSSIRQPT